MTPKPGCIPCKTLAGVTPVAPHVYAVLEGWRTPEVRRSKEPFVETYPRRNADKKVNSTPKIFRPKCMECTLAPKKFCETHTEVLSKEMKKEVNFAHCQGRSPN